MIITSYKKRLTKYLSILLFSVGILPVSMVHGTTDVWIDNDDGTVTDVATGLMWERGRGSSTQSFAFIYCQNLNLGGYSDWRLPNVKELTSIIDYRAYFPAIDTRAFISTNNNAKFWSSTDFAGDTSQAFAAAIIDGEVKPENKTVLRRVRCVR